MINSSQVKLMDQSLLEQGFFFFSFFPRVKDVALSLALPDFCQSVSQLECYLNPISFI